MTTTAIILITCLGLVFSIFFYFLQEALWRTKYKFLEIIPPLSNGNQNDAIEMYFAALHGLLRRRGLKFWQPARHISLELESEKGLGIRYIAVVPEEIARDFQSLTIAHLPTVKFRQINDYVRPGVNPSQVETYKLKKSFIFPLHTEIELGRADPLVYSIGALTKLEEGEIAAIQLVIASSAPYAANKQLRNLIKAYDSLQKLGPVDFVKQAMYEQMVHKIQQPLFKVRFRAYVSADQAENIKRLDLIRQATSTLEGDSGQRIIRERLHKASAFHEYSNRYLGLFTNNHDLFSKEELSLMFHFPNASNRTENLNRSLSRYLPAPISLKNSPKLDILLGINKHQGDQTAIGLTEAERQRHVYILGGTGNGKTTMLQYAITQDIKAGKGLAVIDPHGDLAESLLKHIPEDRISDVIYFNPDDITYPIGMNLLELPDGLSGDELIKEKDLITEATISVMRKIFSDDDTGGHRIEYILRNTVQTALTLDNPTLFTIYDLLNDLPYRIRVVRNLKDKDLQNFWKNEFGKAGEFQRIKMTAGITAKIGRFLFSASAKRVLEQEKSTIDFDDIINSQKILICNFSKGLLGEDTSTLFGTTVLAKLQMASLRRAKLSQADRKPFYLYVDEFQSFATMSFVQMLSEARKYMLYLTIAEQSTAQQDYQRLVDIILANVGTLVCFRSGSPADEELVLPLFSPFIGVGEIPNLPIYNFYMRIAAIDTQEPLSGETILINNDVDLEAAAKVISSSRAKYATSYESGQYVQEVSQGQLDI